MGGVCALVVYGSYMPSYVQVARRPHLPLQAPQAAPIPAPAPLHWYTPVMGNLVDFLFVKPEHCTQQIDIVPPHSSDDTHTASRSNGRCRSMLPRRLLALATPPLAVIHVLSLQL